MTPLVFFLLAAAFCSAPAPESSYHGFRVVKSCISMMKDDMELMRGIDFNTIAPKNIKDSNEDDSLTLERFKPTNFSANVLTFSKCNVTLGVLHAVKEAAEQTINFNFEWTHVEFGAVSKGTPGSLSLKAKKVELQQKYDGKVNTTAIIKWEVGDVKMNNAPGEIVNWAKRLLNREFGKNVNEEVNKKLTVVSEKIIKSYTELKIAMEGNEEAVTVENRVYQSVLGRIKGQDYIVLNFQPTFKNSKHSHTVTATLKTSFATPKPFDYKVCYSSRFFGGFVNFRAQFQAPGEHFLNEFKETDYPSRVAFFRRFVPGLSLRYNDDVKVATSFRGDVDKKVQYTGKSIVIPSICDFTAGAQRLARFRTDYEASYAPAVENQRVRVALAEARVASFASEPPVEHPALLAAADFASSFRSLVAGYVIAKKEGLFVDTVRNNNYIFSEAEIKGEEVCLLYKDKEKHAY